MSPIPLILDTDPGIDDTVALMLALASPEVDLLGISTSGGNHGCRETFENAHRLLQLFGRTEIPVGYGVEMPGTRSNRATHIHGEDGLGNTGLPLHGDPEKLSSVDLTIRLANEHPDPVTLVVVAPLTNVAAALHRSPEIKQQLTRVIVMGGAVKMSGNTTSAAEANIYSDPEAAAEVINCGIPLLLIPLDVSTQTHFTPRHLARFNNLKSPQADFFRRLMTFHIEATRIAHSREGSHVHDAIALAASFDDSFLQTEPVHCVIETKGEWTRGMTHCDFRYGSQSRKEPNIEVALDIDEIVFMELLCDRLIAFLKDYED